MLHLKVKKYYNFTLEIQGSLHFPTVTQSKKKRSVRQKWFFFCEHDTPGIQNKIKQLQIKKLTLIKL